MVIQKEISEPISTEIAEALSHPDPVEQQFGIAAISDYPQVYGGEIVAALARLKTSQTSSIFPSFCRRRFAYLARPYRTSPALGYRHFRIGGGTHQQEKEFLSGVRRLLAAEDSEAKLDLYLPVLAEHGALYAEYERILGSLFNRSVVARFRRISQQIYSIPYPRQIGFAPTFKCNLSCPYCFSKDREKSHASPEDIRLVCRWAARAGIEKLRLYGGEPTYYRYFPELLSGARKNGLKIYMASNLIISKPVLDLICSPLVERISAHVRSPALISGSSERFWQNAEQLQEQGVELILRYNLIDENWDFLTDGARRLGLKKIAFAPPVFRPDNSHSIEKRLWKKDANLINRFVRHLEKNILMPVLVRPQPLCCVPDQAEAPWHIYVRHCGIHRNSYTFNALIRPDLKVALCDADMAEDRPRITDFKDWDDLRSTTGPLTRQWFEQPLWPICLDCYFRERGLCQGACLGAKSALPGEDEDNQNPVNLR